MSALGYRIVEDGWFLPRGVVSHFDLVYDADGRLVPESTLRRGEDTMSRAPLRLPPRVTRSGPRTVAESLVFLGPYDFEHYGHWATEGLARFWYLGRHPGDDVEAAVAPDTADDDARRRLTGDFREWRIAFEAFRTRRRILHGATRARRIVVPDCSIRNRGYVHREHLDVTRKIAGHLLGDERPAACAVPVYLSRTRLERRTRLKSALKLPPLKSSPLKLPPVPRRFDGELEIEQYCAARGFRIVHPEYLSLRDQVRLFNAHDVFIGIQGSAFHTSLFRLRRKRVCHIYLCGANRERWSVNYDAIDSLMGNASYRITCAARRGFQHFALDARTAIDGIASHVSTL